MFDDETTDNEADVETSEEVETAPEGTEGEEDAA